MNNTNQFQDGFSEEVWATTYKDHNDVSLSDSLRRVAKTIASVEVESKRAEWEEKFFDMLTDFKGVSGGRILSNAGTEWQNTSFMNCFVGPLPDQDLDSINGIFKVLVDQANTLKSEGGWGMDFSWIRPRGAFIGGVGVESPGAVKFMELFDKSSEIVTAGSGKKSTNKKAKGKIRKGAMMGVLCCSHPDIVEFITAKQTQGRLSKFNMSVNCTDEFMSLVVSGEDADWPLEFPDTTHSQYKAEWQGDLKAWKAKGYPVQLYDTVKVQWLWNLIMESTYNRAEPGVLFLDRANAYNPLSYGETILATNPSMPAGTLVHTTSGIFPIEKLEGKDFQVKSMDGTVAAAKCFLSGESEPVLEFNIGSLKNLRSTKQHRWPVYDKRMNRVYKVDAADLKVGDLIPMNRNERIGINGDTTLTRDEGLFVGYLVGDGWYNTVASAGNDTLKGGITFNKSDLFMAEKIKAIAESLSGKTYKLAERESEYNFQFGDAEFSDKLRNRYKLEEGSKDIPQSVWEGNDEYLEGFIDGLLSTDGHVYNKESHQSIQLTTSRESLAMGFAKLLSFAGISANITASSTKEVEFPNGKDYDKEYFRWDVKVTGNNLVNFCNVFDITHPEKKEKLASTVAYVIKNTRAQVSSKYVCIKSVKEIEPQKVWDISVYHDQHVFPSEWCYTGNCGEQTLAPGGVCCLGTINLTQFVTDTGFDLEKLKKYVGYMVRFLDNVSEKSDAPLPEYKASMLNKRRIGAGVMGWGSALFMLKVRFGSKEAEVLREQVMSTYARAAYEASIDLAVEKGMFLLCDPDKHAQALFVQNLGLSPEYMHKLRTTGIRNSSVMSQQPNGNTSILANIVSGGIEPVFMPEYIRTVIVSVVPDHIKEVTPRYYEGAFEETSMFKFVKEGDEDILRGVDEFGTVFKIDRSRGLTKEVLCEDYGVRYLKAKGQWDAKADWASTTTNLSVQDHVNDLKGFARWTDSACSKTANIPNDYPYEDFKTLYTEVYKTGYIKGFTTYRAGTMTSVLSAKEEDGFDDEEIIVDDVKLPDSLPAQLKTLRAEGRKWYLTVIQNESQTRPVALFVQTNAHEKSITANTAVENLIGLARAKGVAERHIQDVETKMSSDTNASKICRTISLCLRHGVNIKSIVAKLDKTDCLVGSFVFHVRKFLASLIKDGELVADEKCLECGSPNVVYQEGCKVCKNCGSSKCG